MTRAALGLAVLLSGGCAFALYPPWASPPEVRQAPVRVPAAALMPESADVAALAILARVMIDAGEPVNEILATLVAEGLSQAQAKKVLYAALAPKVMK